MTARAAPSGLRSLFSPEHALKLLLIFVPLAALGRWLEWGGVPVFVCAGLAIVPLAGIMGEATERLAARLGSGVGGLLNATFGNAAELIIALVALSRGYPNVVKASLTGSIIGNVLLVLGFAIFAGGLRRHRQTFDRAAAGVGSTLLVLAAIGFVVPAVFHHLGELAVLGRQVTAEHELALERGLSIEISIVLLIAYAASLVFSLRTHKHLFAGPSHDDAHDATARPESPWRAVLMLVGATLLVAWMSELLVGAVEEAAHALGLTQVFVGVIVVAIIGNAAEHSTAVLVAIKDKMDLAMHIAIGSSTQIALFVAPVLVFASYLLPGKPMDLLFTPFEVLAVLMAVATAKMVAEDGESNWLEGLLLIAVYVVIGIAFYFLP